MDQTPKTPKVIQCDICEELTVLKDSLPYGWTRHGHSAYLEKVPSRFFEDLRIFLCPRCDTHARVID